MLLGPSRSMHLSATARSTNEEEEGEEEVRLYPAAIEVWPTSNLCCALGQRYESGTGPGARRDAGREDIQASGEDDTTTAHALCPWPIGSVGTPPVPGVPVDGDTFASSSEGSR